MSISFQSMSLIRIVGMIIITSLFAQLTIDIGDIPITGQTFAVLACAAFLCVEEAIIAMVLYVVLGAAGLPIFADGESGLSVLQSGSGGYLVGFIVAAAYVAYESRRKLPESILRALLLMAIGTVIILIFGVGRLSMMYGMEKGLEYGLYPFWKGAVVKVFLSGLAVWGGYLWMGRKGIEQK